MRTFQHVRLFKDMTAVENLLVAQHRHLNTGFLAGLFKTPAFRRAEREGLEQSAFWLEKVGLRISPTAPPATWPTASSAGSRLPAAWRPGPSC